MSSMSVVLFQVDVVWPFTLSPDERHAPRPVDPQTIATWCAATQRMAMKAWHKQISKRVGIVEHVQTPQHARDQSGRHFPATTRAPKLRKCLASKAVDHPIASVACLETTVNDMLTVLSANGQAESRRGCELF
jgi:hypothetical protein